MLTKVLKKLSAVVLCVIVFNKFLTGDATMLELIAFTINSIL